MIDQEVTLLPRCVAYLVIRIHCYIYMYIAQDLFFTCARLRTNSQAAHAEEASAVGSPDVLQDCPQP